MRHIEAVQEVTRELGFQPMSADLLNAFRFLVDNVDAIDDLAEGYIYELEDGVLSHWIMAYENYQKGRLGVWDLEDQRMMGHEEERYIAAHRLVGREIEWPEGYLETTIKEEE